ncbi:MAG: hypothetical protein ACK2T3_04220 [Candidatus Promineifilaceae bacterium]|jgi:hypothetical protein
MNFKPAKILPMIFAVVILSILAACGSSTETSESGAPAMVDSVRVELRDRQYYAVVDGNYPDPCTFISSVEQEVDENTISITLLTASPADLGCAAVLAPFTADILLATGGLMPQEYTVVINEGPSTTFSIG